MKSKYTILSVLALLTVSTVSYAAAGPSVSKTLTVNVKATAALTANWVAPANIYAEQWLPLPVLMRVMQHSRGL